MPGAILFGVMQNPVTVDEWKLTDETAWDGCFSEKTWERIDFFGCQYNDARELPPGHALYMENTMMPKQAEMPMSTRGDSLFLKTSR